MKGLRTEMNVSAGFRTLFKSSNAKTTLHITASTIYKVWLNGTFIGYGPARCGHGYYRVDVWDLPSVSGETLLAIEVCGYNVNGYAYLDQPSFLQAEVLSEQKVLTFSGSTSLKGYHLKERTQKIHRYSYQRPFSEAYRLGPKSLDWKTCTKFSKKNLPLETCPEVKLVPRGLPSPTWPTRQALTLTVTGSAKAQKNTPDRWPREWRNNFPYFKYFKANQKTHFPSHTIEALDYKVSSRKPSALDPHDGLVVSQNKFSVLDFGTNLTGFIALTVECKEEVELYLSFDELDMDNGDINTRRYSCANVIHYQLKAGKYDLESVEPYTLKFLKILSLKGKATVSNIFIREVSNPEAHKAHFSSSDPALGELFIAARETFAQNATDIFMDCPGRERAGWLCDSFFTAKAELALCGHNQVERNFLENFLLSDHYPNLPKGMLPMCYPADHSDGWFIPNWAMWFVIQLEDYLKRSGDRDLIERMRQKVYGLIEYFLPFLNSDGLLEKLEKWVFLEWSEANKFTQDVSYASNMVYVGMLESASRLYEDPALKKQAKSIRKKLLKQSFDGDFFVDNALRGEDGKLQSTTNRTETCQYYAFFFEIATPASHPKLWKKLLNEFGPKRNPKKMHPEIHPSNAFIGFFLRLNLLSRYDEPKLILEQLKMDFLPMAQKTGTLWEHKEASASCNHGFASQIADILIRDILGLDIDLVKHEVRMKVPKIPLESCQAKVPVGDDWIQASWIRKGTKVTPQISLPAGFKLLE